MRQSQRRGTGVAGGHSGGEIVILNTTQKWFDVAALKNSSRCVGMNEYRYATSGNGNENFRDSPWQKGCNLI
jgi:hypothetical protein